MRGGGRRRPRALVRTLATPPPQLLQRPWALNAAAARSELRAPTELQNLSLRAGKRGGTANALNARTQHTELNPSRTTIHIPTYKPNQTQACRTVGSDLRVLRAGWYAHPPYRSIMAVGGPMRVPPQGAREAPPVGRRRSADPVTKPPIGAPGRLRARQRRSGGATAGPGAAAGIAAPGRLPREGEPKPPACRRENARSATRRMGDPQMSRAPLTGQRPLTAC